MRYGLFGVGHGAHLPDDGDFNLAGVLHFFLNFLRNLEAQLGGALVGYGKLEAIGLPVSFFKKASAYCPLLPRGDLRNRQCGNKVTLIVV